MNPTLRLVLLTILTSVAVTFAAPVGWALVGSAASSSTTTQATSDTGIGDGRLTFTDAPLRSSDSVAFGRLTFYEMVPGEPDNEAQRVYFPRSTLTYPAPRSLGFEWTTNGTYDIEGDVHVAFSVGCEYPLAFQQTRDVRWGSFLVELYRDADHDAPALGYAWVDSDALICLPGNIIPIEVTIPVGHVRLDSGMLFGVAIDPHATQTFGRDDPVHGLFVLVGGKEHESAVSAAGLPSTSAVTPKMPDDTGAGDADVPEAAAPGPAFLTIAVVLGTVALLTRRHG